MTSEERPLPKPESSRLGLLLKLLVVVALLWGGVSLIRWLMPPAPLPQARAAVEIGHFEQALDHYRRHLERWPEDWGVRMELGRVLAEIDRPQALVELRKVPPEYEEYVEARRQIISICLTSERLQEAEEVLLELAEAMPDDYLTQFTLAELLYYQQRARAALPHAQKAVELNPDDAAAQFLLAEVLDDLHRTSEMIAPLEKVVELQLDNYAAHLNLAYAYSEAGDHVASRREAEWCLARKPDDVNARRFLALAVRSEGKNDEAMLEVERALALAPEDLECRLLQAELLLYKQQPEQALESLKPLYERHNNDRRLVALLARSAAAAGLEEEAATYRQQVQKLSE